MPSCRTSCTEGGAHPWPPLLRCSQWDRRVRKYARKTVALFAIFALPACRRPVEPRVSTSGAELTITDSLQVIRVTPNPVIVYDGRSNEIRIEGRGFHPTSNTIALGPVTVGDVASRDNGTVLLLSVPDRVPSGGGAAPLLWVPGRYPLTVTAAGQVSVPYMTSIARPE